MTARLRPAGVAPLLVALLTVLPLAEAASAAVGLATVPGFPVATAIGQPAQAASITIQNRTTPPDAGQMVLSLITLVPSCGVAPSSADCPAASADPGVFQFSDTGTGEGGTACVGVVFAITVVDPVQGKVQFAVPKSGSPVVLGPPGSRMDSCRIAFTVKAVKLPAKDAQPAVPGIQTAHLAAAFGVLQPSNAAIASLGASLTTVAGIQPTLVGKATPTVAIGVPLTDTVTLAAGPASIPPATGSIAFKLFGPDDSSCARAPVATSTKAVNGAGTYTSDPFPPTAVGSYRYVASYSGDNTASPAATNCGDADQVSTVTKATPGISVTVSPPVGATVSGSATLAGAVNPTGSFEFRAYGPADDTCSASPAFTATQPADAHGTASATFTTSKPGVYHLMAGYSGDADNNAVTTACSDATATVAAPAATKPTKPAKAQTSSKNDRPRRVGLAVAAILLVLAIALLLASLRRRSKANRMAARPSDLPTGPVTAIEPAPPGPLPATGRPPDVPVPGPPATVATTGWAAPSDVPARSAEPSAQPSGASAPAAQAAPADAPVWVVPAAAREPELPVEAERRESSAASGEPPATPVRWLPLPRQERDSEPPVPAVPFSRATRVGAWSGPPTSQEAPSGTADHEAASAVRDGAGGTAPADAPDDAMPVTEAAVGEAAVGEAAVGEAAVGEAAVGEHEGLVIGGRVGGSDIAERALARSALADLARSGSTSRAPAGGPPGGGRTAAGGPDAGDAIDGRARSDEPEPDAPRRDEPWADAESPEFGEPQAWAPEVGGPDGGGQEAAGEVAQDGRDDGEPVSPWADSGFVVHAGETAAPDDPSVGSITDDSGVNGGDPIAALASEGTTGTTIPVPSQAAETRPAWKAPAIPVPATGSPDDAGRPYRAHVPEPLPDRSILPDRPLSPLSPDRLMKVLKAKATAPVIAGSAVVAYLFGRSRTKRRRR